MTKLPTKEELDELERDVREGCRVVREDLLSLIAAARELEEQRWIPVTERLPGEGIGVLVVSVDRERSIYAWHRGEHDGPGKRRSDWDSWTGGVHNVTHWMPLPSPPKKPQCEEVYCGELRCARVKGHEGAHAFCRPLPSPPEKR